MAEVSCGVAAVLLVVPARALGGSRLLQALDPYRVTAGWDHSLEYG